MLEAFKVIDEMSQLQPFGTSEVDVRNARKGDLFRATTHSGNVYFIEVTDPDKRTALVARKEIREGSPNRFIGESEVSLLKVGQSFNYRRDGTLFKTSSITELYVLLSV